MWSGYVTGWCWLRCQASEFLSIGCFRVLRNFTDTGMFTAPTVSVTKSGRSAKSRARLALELYESYRGSGRSSIQIHGSRQQLQERTNPTGVGPSYQRSMMSALTSWPHDGHGAPDTTFMGVP